MICASCDKELPRGQEAVVCGICQGRLLAAGMVVCPMCRREVPIAPTFRGAEGQPCAHSCPYVGPDEDALPCPNAPRGESAFEPEIQQEVHSNPRWWCEELGGGAPLTHPVAPPHVQDPATPPRVVAPPKVGATKVSFNEKGDFVIRTVVAPPGPVAPPIEAEDTTDRGTIGYGRGDDVKPEAAPKRAPRKRKKAEDVDVDSWEP